MVKHYINCRKHDLTISRWSFWIKNQVCTRCLPEDPKTEPRDMSCAHCGSPVTIQAPVTASFITASCESCRKAA